MSTNSQLDPPDESIVTVERAATAIQFLEKLHAISLQEREEIFPGWHVRLCYRGVASVSHQLIPAALRADANLERFAGAAARYRVSEFSSEKKLTPEGGQLTSRDIEIQSQMHLEFGVLMEFCRFADQSGLPMPHLNPVLREVIREPSAHFTHAQDYFDPPAATEWPPDELVDALALAQHYGMPTRLLDWTRDPFVAAYFATSHSIERQASVADHLIESECLAVWAFKESFAGYLRDKQKRTVLLMPLPPYHGNPNLAAQRGLFTLWRPHDQAQVIDREPLTKLVAGWINEYHKDLTDKDIFTRVELPAKEARRLLRLLMDRGYDAARLFPGYAGAARAVREQAIVGCE